jgi:hypothetical protein
MNEPYLFYFFLTGKWNGKHVVYEFKLNAYLHSSILTSASHHTHDMREDKIRMQ